MRGVSNVHPGEPRRSLAATQALWRRVSWSDVASRNSGCPCTGTQAPFRTPHQAEEHGTHNTDAAERKLARRSPIPKCRYPVPPSDPLSLSLHLFFAFSSAVFSRPFWFSSVAMTPANPSFPFPLPSRSALLVFLPVMFLRALGVVGQCLWGGKRNCFVTAATLKV